MAHQWEEAPFLYMKLDIKSLLHGDDLEENGIEEGQGLFNNVGNLGPSTDEQKEDGQEEHLDEVKALGKSKWSNDLDDDDVHKTEATRGNSSALSSLFKSYSKKAANIIQEYRTPNDSMVEDELVGFSIGAGKTANVSLVIDSGSDYNLKSNPLPEEEKLNQRYTGESRRQNVFQEQLRAERESFRAVIDKRKQRIGGLNACEE
ncbi:hypothetical protein C2S51_035530 [Perilla frutescens var. frutescens]|nr:hypothetical protein C2S51_035530 [Perilla frutescens var. frutescens]